MPFKKIAAIAAAAVLASIALMVAFDGGEQVVTTSEPQLAAVPLAELPKATTTAIAPEQPKEGDAWEFLQPCTLSRR